MLKPICLCLCLFLSLSGSGLLAGTPTHGAVRRSLHGPALPVDLAPGKRAGLETALLLDPDAALVAERTLPDGVRGHVTRYRQTHQGLPVFGAEAVAAYTPKGALRTLHGAIYDHIDLDLTTTPPTLTEADALARALALTGLAPETPRGSEHLELGVQITDDGGARPAYAVSFFTHDAQGRPTRPYLIIDATDGRLLRRWEGLTTSDVGTGPGGNGATGVYEYGTDFAYLDVAVSGSTYTLNNADVRTVDLGGATSGNTAYSYAGPRNTYTAVNGAYCPLNDAHHMGGVIVDMYRDLAGTAPLSFQLIMRVHYGTNAATAFWDGSGMNFGDGNSTYYPLVTMDVAGHEVSHGFTEQHSALVYAGESGGINEAFSDIAGEAAEYYNTGSNDWLIGGEVIKAGGALRYMDQPPLDGVSIEHQDDYTAGMDVHYSSGIYNKAYYLLSTSAGWTPATAFAVFARANRLYWTSSTTFDEGACGVLDAASDLGYATADVEAAFAAVGVTCGGTTPPSCRPRNGPCTTNGDCCSGTCRTRRGVCR